MDGELLNIHNRKGNNWGNVYCSADWKRLYLEMGATGFAEEFYNIEHIFLPIDRDLSDQAGESLHGCLFVISPINRTVEFFDSYYAIAPKMLQQWQYCIFKIFDYLKYDLGDSLYITQW